MACFLQSPVEGVASLRCGCVAICAPARTSHGCRVGSWLRPTSARRVGRWWPLPTARSIVVPGFAWCGFLAHNAMQTPTDRATWTLPAPALGHRRYRRQSPAVPAAGGGFSPWWFALAALLMMALLQAYQTTVHQVVDQGDARRVAVAQQAEERWRCQSLPDRRQSGRCLARLASEGSAAAKRSTSVTHNPGVTR